MVLFFVHVVSAYSGLQIGRRPVFLVTFIVYTVSCVKSETGTVTNSATLGFPSRLRTIEEHSLDYHLSTTWWNFRRGSSHE